MFNKLRDNKRTCVPARTRVCVRFCSITKKLRDPLRSHTDGTRHQTSGPNIGIYIVKKLFSNVFVWWKRGSDPKLGSR